MVQGHLFPCFIAPSFFAALIASGCADVEDVQEPDVVFGSVPRCGAPNPPSPVAELALEGDRRRAFFAAHPLPLLTNRGGPVIANPRVIAVFFGEHPLRRAIEAMLQSYGCSAAWRDAVAEYGVGDASYERTVELPAPPQFNEEKQVSDWLTEQVEAGAIGPVTHENVIVLFPPEGTKWLSDDCVGRLGYHSEIAAGEDHFPYAVLLQCPTPGWTSRLDQTTHEISHELIEVATDPLEASAPAWRGLDIDESAWTQPEYDLANEDADFCDNRAFARADFPVSTATAWSNRRARAGLDPCGPSPNPLVAVGARQRQIDLSNGPVDLDVDVYDEDPELDVMVEAFEPEGQVCESYSSPSMVYRDGSVVTIHLVRAVRHLGERMRPATQRT